MDNSVIQRNRVSDLINNEISFKKKKHHSFGDMSENRFWLLIEISPIHSEKVIAALKDHLVLGYARREACERNGVAVGYFSLSLAKIIRIENAVTLLTMFQE
ncbi:PabB family transcriptional regulator [Salmonella enterica subsp. enterica serovar Newport]|uniref:PabB family transcriptional regulator n=1 Tax=Salmonella newport TaxID=108619 RepID=A0A618W813_SALNE|nr:PabB family transcriptional regulator [Salmonella enterica subsp. enterica serovar Newport]EAM1615790.1 PabB family transcriptional regulator [Salmonella enterica]ECC3466105.1 PabB family transcriptional regulator [Salmonella enterica subsp. enterica]EAM2519529.1 PabB family transcriptional regulator [Salmonella enterica]EAM2620400.1 PabB family transcriptional regulator [Salmonella enterica]